MLHQSWCWSPLEAGGKGVGAVRQGVTEVSDFRCHPVADLRPRGSDRIWAPLLGQRPPFRCFWVSRKDVWHGSAREHAAAASRLALRRGCGSSGARAGLRAGCGALSPRRLWVTGRQQRTGLRGERGLSGGVAHVPPLLHCNTVFGGVLAPVLQGCSLGHIT